MNLLEFAEQNAALPPEQRSRVILVGDKAGKGLHLAKYAVVLPPRRPRRYPALAKPPDNPTAGTPPPGSSSQAPSASQEPKPTSSTGSPMYDAILQNREVGQFIAEVTMDAVLGTVDFAKAAASRIGIMLSRPATPQTPAPAAVAPAPPPEPVDDRPEWERLGLRGPPVPFKHES